MSRFWNFYKQTLTRENIVGWSVFGTVFQGALTARYQMDTNQPLDSTIGKNALKGGMIGAAAVVTWPISLPVSSYMLARDVYNYSKK